MGQADWDDHFMTLVYFVASRSKDKRTHMGAVVVGPHRNIRSTGYNGFVRGSDDSVPERQEKGEKQYWFEHAERNALYNALLNRTSVEGCTMYTNGIPCEGCARGIRQSGIVEVVVDEKWEDYEKRAKEYWRSLKMFEETGIKIRRHDTRYIEFERINDGIILPLT